MWANAASADRKTAVRVARVPAEGGSSSSNVMMRPCKVSASSWLTVWVISGELSCSNSSSDDFQVGEVGVGITTPKARRRLERHDLVACGVSNPVRISFQIDTPPPRQKNHRRTVIAQPCTRLRAAPPIDCEALCERQGSRRIATAASRGDDCRNKQNSVLFRDLATSRPSTRSVFQSFKDDFEMHPRANTLLKKPFG